MGLAFRVRDYLYPLDVLRARRLMVEAPGWSREDLETWSAERRRALLAHAVATVPYYRHALGRAGVRPRQADRPEVWSRIPTLDKQTVRASALDLVSVTARAGQTTWAETSGTTGLKLRVLLDRHVNAAAFALFWRAWGSGGHYRLGQRHASMKGLFHARGWSYNRRARVLQLSSASLRPETARLFAVLVRRYRPRFLRGYPSALTLFCRLLRNEGERLRLPMVITGSETLHDFQRAEIEGSFGARVYDHYTHWERAASVLECEAGSLHAQEDYGHHEILDAEGGPCPPGATGEITVTGLHNLAMPLVRYRTGDMAAWSGERCRCGQAFPVMRRIEGRRADYLLTPSGALIPSTAAAAGLDAAPHVLSSQLIQWLPGRVELRLVRDEAYDHPADTERITADVARRLGPELELEVRFCGLEELERSPAGKVRQCFNRLSERELAAVTLSNGSRH